MAFAKVRESIIFKSTRISQLNGNPTLSKDQLILIKVGIFYMKPKLLTTANHDSMLNFGCDCEVFVLTHMKLELSKGGIPIKILAPIKVWFVGRVHRMRKRIGNHWVKHRDSVNLMDYPSSVETSLC